MASAPTPFDGAVDYYEFLSITSDATESEIQRAYRKTNLKYHPDKFKATSEISAKQAAAKLDLLQHILAVLKDPVRRAEYDSKRNRKRMLDAESEKYESERKRRVVELHKREARAAHAANSIQKPKTEDEKSSQDISNENRDKAKKIMAQRQEEQARLREAVEAQMRKDASSKLEEEPRLVKVMWVRQGNGLDIDEAALKEMCEAFGAVEDVKVLKDRKRRVDGRTEKIVFGIALIVFETPSAAQSAVSAGPWDGVESVEQVVTETGPA